MRYVVASDHAGFALKQMVVEHLGRTGHLVRDLGTESDETSVDYPDVAEDLARAIGRGDADFGVVICGTGIGVSIAANKITGVRAAVCRSEYEARMARAHNDANVLCLGERVTGPGQAEAIIEAWLDTAFEGGRHGRRVGKIRALESEPHRSEK